MNLIELTLEPIDVAQLLVAISHPDAGGEVLFIGKTRRKTAGTDHAADTITDFLVYEAYQPMAQLQIQRLVQQARQRWPLMGVAVVHRLGKVRPQEASIAIAVSAAHRAEAYAASRWLIDNIKQDVPIWKQENFHNSTAPQWVHPTNPQSSSTAEDDAYPSLGAEHP